VTFAFGGRFNLLKENRRVLHSTSMSEKKKSLLFVCLGNICRSPACEAICKSLCGDKLIVASASTSPTHVNETADDRTIDVCSKHGIDIRSHRAKQMTSFDWSQFDVVAALDDNVLSILNRLKPADTKAMVVLFNQPDGIADPYYGGRVGFQKMFDQISEKMKPCLIQWELITDSDLPKEPESTNIV
jgi:protein-tyrosine-phosphatase